MNREGQMQRSLTSLLPSHLTFRRPSKMYSLNSTVSARFPPWVDPTRSEIRLAAKRGLEMGPRLNMASLVSTCLFAMCKRRILAVAESELVSEKGAEQ